MAVLQGISGAVRSQIAGRLNSAVNSTLRTLGTPKNSTWKNPNINTKYSTDVMMYPSNVGSAEQGHYIIFNINSHLLFDSATLSIFPKAKVFLKFT